MSRISDFHCHPNYIKPELEYLYTLCIGTRLKNERWIGMFKLITYLNTTISKTYILKYNQVFRSSGFQSTNNGNIFILYFGKWRP